MRAGIRRGDLILLLAEILLVLLVLPGCFRGETLIRTFGGADMHPNPEADEEEWYYCSSPFALAPGVYRLQVESNAFTEGYWMLRLEDETAVFRGVRGNILNIHPGRDLLSTEYYVTASLDEAAIHCAFEGTGLETVGAIELYRTSRGSRIGLTLLLVSSALLDGMLVLRRRFLEGKITAGGQFAFWCLAGIVLAAYFPYWTDYMFLKRDTSYYLLETEHILQGGAQAALAAVAGELPLLLPALLRGIGFSVMTAHKIFVFVLICGAVVCSYRFFLRMSGHTGASLLGTAAYALSPWCTMVLYRYCALGAYAVAIFLPLACSGVSGILYAKYPAFGRLTRAEEGEEAEKQGSRGLMLSCVELGVGLALLIAGMGLQPDRARGDVLQLVHQMIAVSWLLGAALLVTFVVRGIFRKHRERTNYVRAVGFGLTLVLLLPSLYLSGEVLREERPYYMYTVEDLEYQQILSERMQEAGEAQ